MKAIGYCRVSTVDQADNGVSLDAQEGKIKAWCVLNNREYLGCCVDAGLSGSKAENRPGLTEALKVSCDSKGEVALVVYSLTRLTRSTRDAITIAEKLNRAGADLVSLSENIDTTTAAGKMVYRMLAVLAEFERDQISERTRTAMQHLKQNGKYTGGKAQYGYRKGNDGTLVQVNDEQKVISTIRKLATKKWSYNAIANRLNDLGCATRTGGLFQATQVINILRRTK